MSTKDRSKKKEKFKQEAKTQAAQQSIPRTHLVPIPTWQSTQDLAFRGGFLEIAEKTLFEAMEKLQQLASVLGQVLQHNIQLGHVKIDYVWNNGEKPSEAEVTAFKAEMERVKGMQAAQVDQAKLQENFAKTGLTDADGNPIATTQNLDEEPATQDSDEQPSEDASDSNEAVE